MPSRQAKGPAADHKQTHFALLTLVRLVAEETYGSGWALSRHSQAAIFRPVLLAVVNRVVAVTLCVTVFFLGLPGGSPGPTARAAAVPAAAGNRPSDASAEEASFLLRDAVPAAGFVAPPPDTTEDDDFFLPEETDRKKLVQDIAVFVIVAAFVAVFIIKVFIEKDEEPAAAPPNGKPIPPPE